MAIFDQEAYLTNKAASLRADPTGAYNPYNIKQGAWTGANLGKTLEQFGQTPEQHYQQYGIYEGISPEAKPTNLSMFGQDISGLETGSRSGLPGQYGEQLLSGLMPQLLSSAGSYRSDIDATTQAAKELYASQAKQAMRTGSQDILNRLSSRGMLDSSVASDALAKCLADISTGTTGKGFESAMAGAAMKAQEPTMLGQLAGLGQVSESYDQLAPYKLLMNSYLGMQ